MPPSSNISGPGLIQRRCRVQDTHVVLLRAILEAYDGLGYVYGDGSGVVLVTTTVDQERALDSLLAALRVELAVELL